MKSFLQTKEWLDFQGEIERKVWRYQTGAVTANVILHSLPFGKSYLYIPHGPEINISDAESGLKNDIAKFVNFLRNRARENKSIFVKIEPLNDAVAELMHDSGFNKSKKDLQPRKTVIVDLTQSEDEMIDRMHHKTRYNVRLGEKKGLIVKESDDIDAFWKMLKNTAKADQFHTHGKEYYEKLLSHFRDGGLRTKLFFTYYENKPIAGALIMLYGGDAYYLHGAMDREYKNLMAPYFMHWQIIKMLKGQNFGSYDFWGVDSSKWPGVTRFKMGWGADLVERPGSFDLPISKIWYLAYKTIKRLGM